MLAFDMVIGYFQCQIPGLTINAGLIIGQPEVVTVTCNPVAKYRDQHQHQARIPSTSPTTTNTGA